MGSGNNKTEMAMPVSDTDGVKIGDARLQCDHGKDEIHAHFDKGGLIFCWKGIRAFQLAAQEFLVHRRFHHESVVFRDMGHGNPKGAKPGDLVFRKIKNSWKCGMEPAGKAGGMEIRNDVDLAEFHKFIQEHT